MASGFERRFSSYPGNDVIKQIEGVSVIDLVSVTAGSSVGTGVVCCVGEFEDVSTSVLVSGTGVISTNYTPTEVFGAQDFALKFGGWDETIGNFGNTGGNGFVALRSKQFARLLCVAINIASAQGMRFFRQLPVNAAQTSTLPAVPVIGATVAAGTEFKAATKRVRTASRVQFSALAPIATGTNGSSAVGASGATQTFNAASGFDWTTIVRPDNTLGAHKGDILVVGYNSAGVMTPAGVAGTYRVASEPSSGIAIVVENLDGSNFAWTSQTNVPWRLHFASDADTGPITVQGSALNGGYAAADVGGYVVPVRPLTDGTGSTSGTTAWASALTVAPSVAVTAMTGSTWDPLSGLSGRTNPTTGLSFDPTIQGINAAQSSTMDAAYTNAIASTISQSYPTSEINGIFAARTSATIRQQLKANVLSASSNGLGRWTIIVPELSVQSTSAVVADADPGVGANRDERVFYTWPGVLTYIPEAVNFKIAGSDGLIYTNGKLDVDFAGFYASVLSLLAPERNPGQAADPIPGALSAVLGIQRGVPSLNMNDYITLKSRGVSAIRMDRTVGPIIQSGVTSSLLTGRTDIKRRRMADYIQDSLVQLLMPFSKLPLSTSNKDSMANEVEAFLADLKSATVPANQRINDYVVDDKNGNTDSAVAQGIYTIIVKVQLTPTADFIVLQTAIGFDSVKVTQS